MRRHLMGIALIGLLGTLVGAGQALATPVGACGSDSTSFSVVVATGQILTGQGGYNCGGLCPQPGQACQIAHVVISGSATVVGSTVDQMCACVDGSGNVTIPATGRLCNVVVRSTVMNTNGDLLISHGYCDTIDCPTDCEHTAGSSLEDGVLTSSYSCKCPEANL